VISKIPLSGKIYHNELVRLIMDLDALRKSDPTFDAFICQKVQLGWSVPSLCPHAADLSAIGVPTRAEWFVGCLSLICHLFCSCLRTCHHAIEYIFMTPTPLRCLLLGLGCLLVFV
jgi:hypothetical protein